MTHVDFVTQRDVVIVGAGAAGLTTALSLDPLPALILNDGPDPFDAHTAFAQGGVAVATDAQDIPAHVRDTIVSGDHASDPEAVSVLVREGPLAAEWLETLGFSWDHDEDGRLLLGREGAHSTHRIRHAGGDATGHHLSQHLYREASRRPCLEFWFETRLLDILTDHAGVSGLLVQRRSALGLIRTRRLILATGGYSGLYRPTTSPSLNAGEGLVLAAEAGATLRDLEMVQFHPTALRTANQGSLPLLTEALRGAGARLVTSDGAPLRIDHPLGSLGPRDVVARAIFQSVQEGHDVYLDATGLAEVESRFPTVARLVHQHGYFLSRDLLPVTPAAHYTMGGIVVDLWGRTEVGGLWAVGEVASTGVHGANRLASNSLLECLVFGRRVGRSVASSWISAPSRAKAPTGFSRQPNRAFTAARDTLGRLLFRYAGPVRDATSLQEGLQAVDRWLAHHCRNRRLARHGILARAILESALSRRESRGAHARSDFPRADANGYRSTLWSLGILDRLQLRRIPA